ncbi:MAG: aminoacyl-tRNA hydrolase [Anaerolineales bacterium]|jgi:PTH1 family peptidyl-tRNA hydrolase|nr:aminoacyl-tRNA hydrolase [Anaerolineales bacterium]
MIGRKKPFLIVGLGNPGREYRNNRHNIGFMVLDQLAGKMDTSFSKMKMNALMTAVRYKGQRIILLKPQTFMNLSGKAAASFIRFYKLPLENLLVVYDDVDLPFQTLRMRPNGGDAGQKGVRSIIKELGTKDFPRLRIGINRPPGRMSVSSYVLLNFSDQEVETLPFVLDQAADAILAFVELGLNQAMTTYNQSPSNE